MIYRPIRASEKDMGNSMHAHARLTLFLEHFCLFWARARERIILKTAVEDDKLTQSFESESLPSGGAFPFGNVRPLTEVILTQNLAPLYHLELPFLGLCKIVIGDLGKGLGLALALLEAK